MKQKRLLLLLLPLFLLFVSTGCEKDVHPTEIHYTGKILYLDRKDFRCHNIIEITGASNKKSLPVGSTIGFYSLDFAEKEEIEIRTYSVIYDAIDDVKEAMEGMLSPEIREQVVGNVEIREVFKISKVGSIAGCMVLSGKVTRNSKVRLLRDGIVKYDGELESLKRYKDDVKEVTKGYECGLNLKGYNDIEVGDLLEIYEEVAIKKKLK